MSDPISVGAKAAGGANMDAMKEMQNQMQQMEQQQQTQEPSKFKDSMNSTQVNTQKMSTQHVNKANNPVEVLKTVKAQKSKTASDAVRVQESKGAKKSGMNRIVGDLVNGQNKLEDIMKLAMSGKSFSPQQMLALQAGVYKFSQELELTSKVIEKATGSIKQTMNTQI